MPHPLADRSVSDDCLKDLGMISKLFCAALCTIGALDPYFVLSFGFCVFSLSSNFSVWCSVPVQLP